MRRFLAIAVLFSVGMAGMGCTRDQVDQYLDEEGVTIHFESEGGQAIDPVDALKGVPPTSLPEPDRPGFTFEGWFVDATFDTPYSEAAVRESDGTLTLYARWEPLEGDMLEILFETGPGDSMESILVENGALIEDYTILPDTMENYVFDGWFVDDSYATTFDYSAPVNDHMRLYALWLPVHTVNFYGEDDTLLYTIRMTEGYDTEYVGETPKKASTLSTDYVFSGWDRSLETINEPTDFHAEFTEVPRTYTVSYHDSNHTTVAHTEEVTYGDTLPDHTPGDVPGFAFDGWFTEDTLDTPFDSSTAMTGDLSLYGLWTALHEVRFLGDEGAVLETVDVRDGETVTYGGETPVKAPTASTEYVFDGWDASLEVIVEATDFTPVFTENTRSYTVTYYKADGTSVEHTEAADYGATLNEHIPAAVPGYDFDGWFADDTLATAYDFTATVEGDIVIYGAWSESTPLTAFHEIFDLPKGTEIRTRGVVVQKELDYFTEAYAYVLYDGSDYVWLFGPNDVAEIDDAIVFDATVYVETLVFNTHWLMAPENVRMDATMTVEEAAPLELSVKQIYELRGENRLPFGTPVVISGFYRTPKRDFDPYWVYDPFTEQVVNVNYMDTAILTALQNHEDLPVTIGGRVALHDPAEAEVVMMQDSTVGVSEAVELTDTMILDYLEEALLSTYDNLTFESNEMFALVKSDPFFNAGLTWRTVGDNAALYDMETALFGETDTVVDIGFEVDIATDTLTRTVPFTVTLEPIVVLSINDVYETLAEDDEAWVEGMIVHMEHTSIIIQDSTGYLALVIYDLTGTYVRGDIIRMNGYRNDIGDIVKLQGGESKLSKIGSGTVTHDLSPLSFEAIAQGDASAPMKTEYVEIEGVLVDSGDYYNPFLLLNGGHAILVGGDFTAYPTLLEDHYGQTITLKAYLSGTYMVPSGISYTALIIDHETPLTITDPTTSEVFSIIEGHIRADLEGTVLREGLSQPLPGDGFALGVDIAYALSTADAPYGEITQTSGLYSLTPLDETVATLTLDVTLTHQTSAETAAFTVTMPVEPYDIVTVDTLLGSPESTEGLVDIIILAKPEYSVVLAMDATTHRRFLMTSTYDPWRLEDRIGERYYVEGFFEEDMFIASSFVQLVETDVILPVTPTALPLSEAWNLGDVSDFPFVTITAPVGAIEDPVTYYAHDSFIGDGFSMKLLSHYELEWKLDKLITYNQTPTLTLEGYLIPTASYGDDPMFMAVSAINPGVTVTTAQEINEGVIGETYEAIVYLDSQTDGLLVMADETGVLYACGTTLDYAYAGLDLLGREMIIQGVLKEQDGLRCLDGDPLIYEPENTSGFTEPVPVVSSVADLTVLAPGDYGHVYEVSGILRKVNNTFYIEDGSQRLEIANVFETMVYGFDGLVDERILINVYPMNKLGGEGDLLVYHPDWEYAPDYSYPLTDVERADLVFDELKADVKSDYLSLEPIILKGYVDYFSDYGYGENQIDWALEPGSEGAILDIVETYDPLKRIAYTDTARTITLTLTVSAKDETGDPYILSDTFTLNVSPYEDEIMTLPDFLASAPGTQAVLEVAIAAYDDDEQTVLMTDGTDFVYASNPGLYDYPDGEELLIYATNGLVDKRYHIDTYVILSDTEPLSIPAISYQSSDLATLAALEETILSTYGGHYTVQGFFDIEGEDIVITDGDLLVFNVAESLMPAYIDHETELNVAMTLDIIIYRHATEANRYVLYLTDYYLTR